MGARNLFLLEPHSDDDFSFDGAGFLNRFMYRNMLWAVESLWVLLCNFFLCTFRSVSGNYHAAGDEGCDSNEKSFHFYDSKQQENRERYGKETETDIKTENSEEDNHQSFHGEDEGDSVFMESSSSKYQFSFGSNISGFLEEPKVLNFTVHELFVDPIDSSDFIASNFSEEAVEETEHVAVSGVENASEEVEEKGDFSDHQIAVKEEAILPENDVNDEEEISGELIFSENSARAIDLEVVSVDSDDGFHMNRDKVDSFTNQDSLGEAEAKVDSCTSKGFAVGNSSFWDFDERILEEKPVETDREGDFRASEGFGQKSSSFWDNIDEGIVEEVEEESSSEESYKWDEELGEPEVSSRIEDRKDRFDDSDEEDGYIEMELQDSIFMGDDSSGENGKRGGNGFEDQNDLDSAMEMQDSIFTVGNSGGAEGGDGQRGQDEFDDEDDLDSMWEHDDIIEQLKMELKTARTGGLPTILEESESEKESEKESGSAPVKVADDVMKPLKIPDRKMEHKDRVGEIQKVYKSYAERMRKLDVLNYQTMHAIGLVHLKDPLNSDAPNRPSTSPGIKSLLSPNLLPVKLRRNKIDPAEKSVEAFYGDLEMIYVGQVCLSWEILQWQYGKSRELIASDPYRSRQYNVVAGEVQLFQVLLHRFIENEPFQGPRIENYVKNRCVLRSFLQVPALKDDSFGEKKARVGEEEAVSIEALMEILEGSVRLFWDFVHSDKEEADAIHRACRKTQFNLLDSADLELLITTRDLLQKKERKLKDIVRSGNCIVKRFQKNRDRGNQTVLLVFAQVELRLISRVLNMAKVTRDQVRWCHEKLDRINFVSRKIYVEPSFLLFPC